MLLDEYTNRLNENFSCYTQINTAYSNQNFNSNLSDLHELRMFIKLLLKIYN